MLRFEIIETESEFLQLAAEWRSLCARVPGCALSQTFDWCAAGLRHLSRETDRLRCLTVWDGNLLVAVWPFSVRRTGVISRLDLMGSGLGDYAEPLIDPDYVTVALCTDMLNRVAGVGDVLDLNFLRSGSPMHSAALGCRRVCRRWLFEDFVVDPRESESWQAFMMTYSGNMRHHLRSSRKKLSAVAELSFSEVMGAGERADVIDWVLRQKQAWLATHNLRNDWYFEPASYGFLTDLPSAENSDHYLAIFALRLGEVIVAAEICAVGQDEISGFIIASDSSFHRYSPGMLIMQDTAEWAFERRLAFDLMVNHGLDKVRWANKVVRREAFQFALSPLGWLHMGNGLLADFGRWLSRNLVGKVLRTFLAPARMKAIKAWLGRLRRPRAHLVTNESKSG